MKNNISTIDFFKALYPNNYENLLLEIRAIKNKVKNCVFIKQNEIEEKIDSKIKEFNGKYNVYFGVALRKDNTSGKKENCALLTALFVDIDYGNEGHKKESIFPDYNTALDYINSYPIQPSILVHSGHGFQLYWLLKQPVELTSETIPYVEDILKRLSLSLGGDSTHNVDRIFRIPGTINIKSEPHTQCVIFDYKNRYYDLDEIRNHPMLSVDLDRLKKLTHPYRFILGVLEEDIDRSQFDQKIIYGFVKAGYSDDEIMQIFKNYPTTGKYLERLEVDQKNAERYLRHSIQNAREFHSTNISVPQYKPKYSDNLGYIENQQNKIQLDKNLFFIDEGEEIGYYMFIKGETCKTNNYIIVLEKQIKDEIKHKSYLRGYIKLKDKIEQFFDADISFLKSVDTLKGFVIDIAGLSAITEKGSSELIKAIQLHNKDVRTASYINFGYSNDFNSYNTPELTITKDQILRQENEIIFSDYEHLKSIGFTYDEKISIDEIIDKINEFFELDEPAVTLPALLFVLIPTIFPFTGSDQKPYMVFKGPSGCGKTTINKIISSFFYKSHQLSSWTSTTTSLSVKGFYCKDMIMCVDDLKIQNFNSLSDVQRAMALIQNYSDGTCRSRADVDLRLKEDKPIRAFLAISGEDIVFSESSTIARGIYVEMGKKESNFALINRLMSNTRYYNAFIPYFVKFILGYDKNQIEVRFKHHLDKLNNYFIANGYQSENLPRLANNLSLLLVANDLFLAFLKNIERTEIEPFGIKSLENVFVKLINDNYQLIKEKRPEEKFINTLFDLITNNEDYAFCIDETSSLYSYSSNKDKLIYYSINKDCKAYQVLISSQAFDYVDNYLRNEGGLGNEKSTIIRTLQSQRKVLVNSSNRFHIGLNNNSTVKSGILWITELDDTLKEVLGIPKDYRIVASKNELRDLAVEQNNSSSNNPSELTD